MPAAGAHLIPVSNCGHDVRTLRERVVELPRRVNAFLAVALRVCNDLGEALPELIELGDEAGLSLRDLSLKKILRWRVRRPVCHVNPSAGSWRFGHGVASDG